MELRNSAPAPAAWTLWVGEAWGLAWRCPLSCWVCEGWPGERSGWDFTPCFRPIGMSIAEFSLEFVSNHLHTVGDGLGADAGDACRRRRHQQQAEDQALAI